jgi:AcrR family transcriptional regulator
MRQASESRARTRLIDAFNQLVFDKTPGPIRVSQIVEKAGVGRSTFYDHFGSAEAIHMAALSRPLSHLAAPSAGTGKAEDLQWFLEHFWANRGRAREVLSGGSRDRIARLLAEMIDERIDPGIRPAIPRRLATLQIAEAMLGPIRAWLLGDAAVSSEALARSLHETAAAMRISLGLEKLERAIARD